jgi:hypothetical protein
MEKQGTIANKPTSQTIPKPYGQSDERIIKTPYSSSSPATESSGKMGVSCDIALGSRRKNGSSIMRNNIYTKKLPHI